jgi:hypothetical protein
MRRLLFCSVLLLAGCQNLTGPLAPEPFGRVDDPRLPVGEQQYRARASLGLNDETYLSGPQSGSARRADPGFNR